jgi:transposase
MKETSTIGIDIAKRIFQVHGVDKNGKTVLKKKLMRDQVLIFMANLPKCLVGMEACGGANYWAREISKLGHEVKLISLSSHMLKLIKTIKLMRKRYVKLQAGLA